MNRTTATVGAGAIAAFAVFGGIALAVTDDGPPPAAGNSAAVASIDCEGWTVEWNMLGPGTASGTFAGDVPASGQRSGPFPGGVGGSVNVGFDISSPRDGVPEATASASSVEQCAPAETTEPESEDTEPDGTVPTESTTTTPATTTTVPDATTTTVATTDTTAPAVEATTTTVATPPADDVTEVIITDCAPGSHQVGEGCLLDEDPPAHIKVCRDGFVVEVSYANVRETDNLDLATCGRATGGLPSTE